MLSDDDLSALVRARHHDPFAVLGMHADPKGEILSDAQWAKAESDYLPTASDGDFIASLMNPETEPGKFASWIAPPKAGIDNKPGDFEYVKIENS